MSRDHGLRRALQDALPTGPGFPSPRLLERIMAELPGPPRASTTRRLRWERLSAVAALLLVLVVAEVALEPGRPGRADAGRVEFLSSSRPVEFLSSAAQPASEFRDMNRFVLAGFNGKVDFNSQPTAAQDVQRITYERSTGRSTIDLVALTTSDMATLEDQGMLEDLAPLLRRLQRTRRFPQPLVDYGRSGEQQLFVPWLQATYLMAVNRKALAYLPPGADIDDLTYDQLVAWGERIRAATGQNRIGLPADLDGPRGGLVYRFLQGFAYPSYTGTALTGFRSLEAVQMWETLRRLWSVTSPSSTRYTTMDVPLASGEVWIAWDHQARLKEALADDADFLAIPAPRGPHGRGYLSVLMGLAIPRGAPNRAGAEALIDWLTMPRQQAAAADTVSFFPVVEGVGLTEPQATQYRVAMAYQREPGGVAGLLPSGLGPDGDDFTAVYQDTFARIVLRGEDIATVLEAEVPRLQALVDHAGAPCWPPDPPSRGPCRIS